MPGVEVSSVLQRHGVDASQVDQDVLAYIDGILGDWTDEATPDALYDALGDILASAVPSLDEDGAKDVCTGLAALLAGQGAGEESEVAAVVRTDDTEDLPERLDEVVTIAADSGNAAAAAAAASAAVAEAEKEEQQGPSSSPAQSRKARRKAAKMAAKKAAAAGKARGSSEEGSDDGDAARQKHATYEDTEYTEGTVGIVGMSRCRGRMAASQQTKDILIDLVNVTVGTSDLLNQALLKFPYGRRFGILGRNGVGKSTLMRRIARKAIKGFPQHISTYMLRQDIDVDDRSVLQTVLDADEELTRLQQREQELLGATDPKLQEELAMVYEDLDTLEAHSAEQRATAILRGLAFTRSMMRESAKLLSGGWRMRVALACALYVRPDVLLLDEPTNHLDLDAVLWLERYLVEEFAGTVLVVSHDRAFLDAVATDIVLFRKQTLKYYHGNFSVFEKTARDEAEKTRHIQENLDRKREHIQRSISNMEARTQSKKGRDQHRGDQVASRRKKLGRVGMEKTEDGFRYKMQVHMVPRLGSHNENAGGWDSKRRVTAASLIDPGDPPYRFKLPAAAPLPTQAPLVRLEDVAFAWPGARSPLFQHVTYSLEQGARIALVGPNGTGKSTLLNLINGTLSATQGQVSVERHAVVAYFSQHHVDQLDLGVSPLAWLEQRHPGATQLDLRQRLGEFGIHGNTALMAIGHLSGGQKTRVALATICMTPPNLLILDEPTNHLDLDSIDALSDALAGYQGAVLAVSHNQTLVESMLQDDRGHILVLDPTDHSVTEWDGDFASYVEAVKSSA